MYANNLKNPTLSTNNINVLILTIYVYEVVVFYQAVGILIRILLVLLAVVFIGADCYLIL